VKKNNRHWLPPYCHPSNYLPRIPETDVLFSRPALFFPQFVAKALRFLKSDEARKMGFDFDSRLILPCKWKCADESVFQVDLSLLAYTGVYPFDKGLIGGRFNEGSLGAAVHHGPINLDFGGSHVGYIPGDKGGSFGHIWRPQQGGYSTDCGHLMALLAPFVSIYQDACQNILLFCPPGQDKMMASLPNEFVQPAWSSQSVKLLVDLETFTAQEVDRRQKRLTAPEGLARSLFEVSPEFVESLEPDQAERFRSQRPTPIGRALTPSFFNIFDAACQLDQDGQPRQRLLPYMKYILGARRSPSALKAAIVNTILEHNRLTDAVRDEAFAPYSFACFSGVFIDLFDEETGNYFNLFQPMGLTIKSAGQTRERELSPDEIHDCFDQLDPVEPREPWGQLLGRISAKRASQLFSYEPGRFQDFDPLKAGPPVGAKP